MMKDDLIKKTDEYINRLLAKPDLTPEEFMVLDKRLSDIKFEERQAAMKLEAAETERRLSAVMEAVIKKPGGDINGMQ